MSRRIAVLTCLLVCALVGSAAAQGTKTGMTPDLEKLALEKPVINLVTMGVGSLAWERHGHIALCIEYDDPMKDNACYNYGMGDFLHPLGMAWGFFRANGAFWVDKMDPGGMLSIYKHADRTVWIQPLPLTQAQKQKVIDKLDFDIREENKHYAYDHFWDNCTTRVRDILDDVTDHAFQKMVVTTDDRTYRDLAREGFAGMRLFLLITDLAMGRVTDHVPTYWERMFLPDYLREAVVTLWHDEPHAIYTRKGPLAFKELEKHLADPNLTPAQRENYEQQLEALRNAPTGRVLFCLLILVLTAPAWATRLWGKFQRTGLAVAVAPLALFGLVFWMLSIISPLPYVRWNETCLCLMPFDILLLLLPLERRKKYAKGRVVMLGLMAVLLLINVLRSPIWPALLWALVPNAVVAFMPEKRAPAKPAETLGKRAKSA